jgi:hypothetical protein
MPSLLTFHFQLLTPLAPSCLCALVLRFSLFFSLPLFLCLSVLNCFSPFASLLLRACAKPPRRRIALNLFALAFSAAASPVPAVQMAELAGGDTFPRSRRCWHFQRHAPSRPPDKIRHTAPASRIPTVHRGGKLANSAIRAPLLTRFRPSSDTLRI